MKTDGVLELEDVNVNFPDMPSPSYKYLFANDNGNLSSLIIQYPIFILLIRYHFRKARNMVGLYPPQNPVNIGLLPPNKRKDRFRCPSFFFPGTVAISFKEGRLVGSYFLEPKELT